MDHKGRALMRDQFLDQLGGVHVLPEFLKDVGRANVSIDERVAGRRIDEHGERAVEDRPDAEEPRRSGAERSSAWPWVVGTAVIALAALFWVGFSHREGGQAASAQMPPAQVTVSKAARTRRQRSDRLARPVFGDRPRRIACAGRRYAYRDPFQGWADCP